MHLVTLKLFLLRQFCCVNARYFWIFFWNIIIDLEAIFAFWTLAFIFCLSQFLLMYGLFSWLHSHLDFFWVIWGQLMIRLLLFFVWSLLYLTIQFNFLNIDTVKVVFNLFKFFSELLQLWMLFDYLLWLLPFTILHYVDKARFFYWASFDDWRNSYLLAWYSNGIFPYDQLFSLVSPNA